MAESLLGAQSDLDRIHSLVVRIGAAAAWFCAAVLLAAGLLTGSDHLLVESIGPIVAGGFMTVLIVVKRENGGVALIGSALVVTVMYAVVRNETTLIPASLSLVVICSIGMLFVTRNQVYVLASVALFIGSAPFMWGIEFSAALQLGSIMGLSFVLTTVIFMSIRNAAAGLNNRFKVMFEQSPSALFEEDWSDSVDYVRREYVGPPERIRQFLLAYPNVIRRAVSKSRITRVNQAAIDLLEASGAADLLGSRAAPVSDENLESFADGLVALYEGRDIFERDFVGHTLKGKRVWLQARCVDSARNSRSVLVALADVSSARAKEEALADLVRAKDEFIASISHELRTPLTAVVGLTSEMSDDESMGSEERAELMHLVSGQAAEMSYIVEDLLVAARSEIGNIALDLGDVDLGEQLRAVVAAVAVDLDGFPSALPLIRADAGRVRQILRNLLTNVQRYGGRRKYVVGGSIGERAWVEVRDDGEGVDPAEVDRIFEPYATAHPGMTGSVGLGLAVARQLAELMGGSLRYRRDGQESVFRLELPLAHAHVAA